MSLQQRHKRPPDPGITDPCSTSDNRCIYTLLADIAKYFNNPIATDSDHLQRLSNECNRTWEAIQSYRLTELRLNYRHVESYRYLIRDIHHAITDSNSLTEAETNGFIYQLYNFSGEFERIMNDGRTSFLYRTDSGSGPSFFRNIDRIRDIQHSNLVMNNHLEVDPGVSIHLKHIKYTLLILTTVLF